MNIEDEHPSTLPLQELVADQNKRAKLVRILLHSLHAMGFKESALELQRESNLHFQEQAEQTIKKRFEKRQYQQIFPIIQRLPLPPTVKQEVNQMLAELKVFNLINMQQYETAIQHIYKYWSTQEEKQLNFLSFIAIGKTIESDQFAVLEQQILSKCITDSLQLKNSIQQMLKGYLGLPQLSPLNLQDHRPPENVVACSQSLTYVGKITFVRLHPNQKTICLVAEHSKQTEVSIWEVRGSAIKKDISWHADHFGCINTVEWDKNGDRLAVCSYTKIALLQLNAQMFKPFAIIESKDHFHSKLLTAKWSSDGRLFIGGLFEGLGITDKNGNIIQMIQPFIRTRNLIFESNSQLIAINATKGQIVRFNCESQVLMTSFESGACFMDLRMDVKSGMIVVTNRQFIYLLDARNLKPIATFNSPDNQKMWKIEAFLFKGWLLIFNQKLSALMQNKQASRHHSWPDCDAVDVSNGKMVTANQRITLWDSDINGARSKSEKQSKKDRLVQNGFGDDLQFRSLSSPSDKSSSQEDAESVSSQLSDNFVEIEYVDNEEDEQEFQEE